MARALLEGGWHVRAATRSPERAAGLAAGGGYDAMPPGPNPLMTPDTGAPAA